MSQVQTGNAEMLSMEGRLYVAECNAICSLAHYGSAVSDYGIDEKDAEEVCRRFNKKRAKYYAFNTSRKWDDMSNYDMVLDSSRIGIDGCVRAIAALLE